MGITQDNQKVGKMRKALLVLIFMTSAAVQSLEVLPNTLDGRQYFSIEFKEKNSNCLSNTDYVYHKTTHEIVVGAYQTIVLWPTHQRINQIVLCKRNDVSESEVKGWFGEAASHFLSPPHFVISPQSFEQLKNLARAQIPGEVCLEVTLSESLDRIQRARLVRNSKKC